MASSYHRGRFGGGSNNSTSPPQPPKGVCFIFCKYGKCDRVGCLYKHSVDDYRRLQSNESVQPNVHHQSSAHHQPQYNIQQLPLSAPHSQVQGVNQNQNYNHFNLPLPYGLMNTPGRILVLETGPVGFVPNHMGYHGAARGIPLNHMGLEQNQQDHNSRIGQITSWNMGPQPYSNALVHHNLQLNHNAHQNISPMHQHSPSQSDISGFKVGTLSTTSSNSGPRSIGTNIHPPTVQKVLTTHVDDSSVPGASTSRNSEGIPTGPRRGPHNHFHKKFQSKYGYSSPHRPWENRSQIGANYNPCSDTASVKSHSEQASATDPETNVTILEEPNPTAAQHSTRDTEAEQNSVALDNSSPDIETEIAPVVQEDLIDLCSQSSWMDSGDVGHKNHDEMAAVMDSLVDITEPPSKYSAFEDLNSLMLPEPSTSPQPVTQLPNSVPVKAEVSGLAGLKERIQMLTVPHNNMNVLISPDRLSPTALEQYNNTLPHLRGKLYLELCQLSEQEVPTEEDPAEATELAEVTWPSPNSRATTDQVGLISLDPLTATSSFEDLKSLENPQPLDTSDCGSGASSYQSQDECSEEEANSITAAIGKIELKVSLGLGTELGGISEEAMEENEGDSEAESDVFSVGSKNCQEDEYAIEMDPPLFYTPPSTPIPTTRVLEPFIFQPSPLPFHPQMSYDQFKRSSICVSSSSFERLYKAPNYEQTGPEKDFANLRSLEKLEQLSSQPVAPRNTQSFEDTDENLLGPKPRPRRKYVFERSRTPSPDNSKVENGDLEPRPLFRIARQHIFDIAYCWNCWSRQHKASECSEPERDTEEREALRIQKRVVSKSWARALEAMGRQAAIIPIAGMTDEEAYKFQSAAPLRHKYKPMRSLSPVVADRSYEPAPGDEDWWNRIPPVPEVSDAEIEAWGNVKISQTPPAGTFSESTWSDSSMESGSDTSASPKPKTAHMDVAPYHSINNLPSTLEGAVGLESELAPSESTIQAMQCDGTMELQPTVSGAEASAEERGKIQNNEHIQPNFVAECVGEVEGRQSETDVMDQEREEVMRAEEETINQELQERPKSQGGSDNEGEQKASGSRSGWHSPSGRLLSSVERFFLCGYDPNDWIQEEGVKVAPPSRLRAPRPEEIPQERKVIFIGSQAHTSQNRRHSSIYPTPEECSLLNQPRGYQRGGYRPYSRFFRPGKITLLPAEILTQILEYVAWDQLDEDPREEETTHLRARAECTRALSLKFVRLVNRDFYSVTQKMIYTHVAITSQFDLDRFLRVVQFRSRLSSLVREVTVDIPQLKLSQVKASTPGKMPKSTFNLIRGVYGIFETCKSMKRFAFHCTGAIQAFGRLDGEYPSIESIVVSDLIDIGKSSEDFWRRLPLFPNLEDISLIRGEEHRNLDYRTFQVNPIGKSWFSRDYSSLQAMRFRHCADISDKILLGMLPNMPSLSRLHLYECKLVTSSGIARVIKQINHQLTDFLYYDYVDCDGKTSFDEQKVDHKSKRYCHLCTALASCPNLYSLTIGAYRICPQLFLQAHWEYMDTLRVDMMFFTNCVDDGDDDMPVRIALLDATKEKRIPRLRKETFFYQTNSPRMVYRRNYKHTQEQLERASGFIR